MDKDYTVWHFKILWDDGIIRKGEDDWYSTFEDALQGARRTIAEMKPEVRKQVVDAFITKEKYYTRLH